MRRQKILFGAHGQVGASIFALQPDAHAVPWSLAREPGGLAAPLARPEPLDWIFANGLTDPRASASELMQSNLGFPLRVIEAARARPWDRFLTMGSVHEGFPEMARANPYLASKLALAQEIQALAIQPAWKGRVLHLRFHTLYGQNSRPHMFLAQMLAALEAGRPFEMSSGLQLREYHHADDIAGAVGRVLDREWTDLPAALDVSFGRPVRLIDLAQAVFRHFGREDLLKAGALTGPGAEVFEPRFQASEAWLLPQDRDQIRRVIAFAQSRLDPARG